jgi:uncharacterized membrane protein
VPVHWNIKGEADRFGPPWELAILMPAILLGLSLLLVALPAIGPFKANFARFRETYGRVCVTIVAGLVGVHGVILAKAAGADLSIGAALAIVIGLMLALMGNWFGKIRRNLYVGIRTPWTIANDRVWEKTHRLGGKLFIIVGLASAVAGFLAPDVVCFVILVGGTLGATLWAVFYSLYWYRKLGEVDDLQAPQRDGA